MPHYVLLCGLNIVLFVFLPRDFVVSFPFFAVCVLERYAAAAELLIRIYVFIIGGCLFFAAPSSCIWSHYVRKLYHYCYNERMRFIYFDDAKKIGTPFELYLERPPYHF